MRPATAAATIPIDAVNVNDTNRNAWLFVVALDPQVQSAYALAGYSNKAGSMADRTVTAVGTNVTTRLDGSVATFSGTSSAAAQVSGLAATILGKWPQLTGEQAGRVILATARDIGSPGIDATFGAGLIDAQAALSPVNPTLSNGSVQTCRVDVGDGDAGGDRHRIDPDGDLQRDRSGYASGGTMRDRSRAWSSRPRPDGRSGCAAAWHR